MLDYFVISHITQDKDIVYYNQKIHTFVDNIENSTWYNSKVDALLICRKELNSYINIKIEKVGVC